MYINKAIVYGNLTRDPEMRALPSGIKVTTLSIATNRVWKDQSGAKKEMTDYHNVVVFGRQAETVSQYLRKGNGIFVEGRMQTRSWEQDGQKKYRTEIVADRVQFGPKGSASSGSSTASTQAPAPKEDSNDGLDTIEYPDEEINVEDIPF